jgi:hypothetical protein
MVNPHTLTLDIKEYNSKSYLSWLLYGFTAIIFTALNLFVLKIIATQELPKGQVAWMVMGFSFFAFLSYLSLLPQKDKIKKYNTLIWGTLLLQSLVLLGSISVRVWEYGITEKRYLLLAYGLWLFAISLYFLWKRLNAKIFCLFASLSLVVLLSQVGPINGYMVSKYSQQQRFMTLLEVYKKDERFKKDSSYHDLYSIFRYLKRTHGSESISEIFPNIEIKDFDSLDNLLENLGIKLDKEDFSEHYKKPYAPKDYQKIREKAHHISGYDYLFIGISNPYGSETTTLNMEKNLSLSLAKNEEKLSIKISGEELQFNIKNFAIKLLLLNKRYLSSDEMTLVKEGTDYKVKIIFSKVSVNPSSKSMEDWDVDIYVKSFG